jgi:hypothetical protein
MEAPQLKSPVASGASLKRGNKLKTSYLIRLFSRRKTITARLIEACDALTGLRKLGNYNSEYKYLRILDITNALRGELFQRGLLLISSDIECEHESWTSPDFADRIYTEYRVRTQFTVSDGHHKISFFSYGVGRDMDGKALFIAQTGALKAWLKRLGLIFGEWDDPEVETGEEYPRRATTALASYQERAWHSALKSTGKTADQIDAYLSTQFGFEVSTQSIAELSRKDFDVAMRWLLQNGELIDTMQTSVKHIKKSAGNVA